MALWYPRTLFSALRTKQPVHHPVSKRLIRFTLKEQRKKLGTLRCLFLLLCGLLSQTLLTVAGPVVSFYGDRYRLLLDILMYMLGINERRRQKMSQPVSSRARKASSQTLSNESQQKGSRPVPAEVEAKFSCLLAAANQLFLSLGRWSAPVWEWLFLQWRRWVGGEPISTQHGSKRKYHKSWAQIVQWFTKWVCKLSSDQYRSLLLWSQHPVSSSRARSSKSTFAAECSTTISPAGNAASLLAEELPA